MLTETLHHPVLQDLCCRLDRTIQHREGRPSRDMRLFVQAVEISARERALFDAPGMRGFVTSSDMSELDWLKQRQSELIWIDQILVRNGQEFSLPSTELRPTSRAHARQLSRQNKPSAGGIWPLHFASGLALHIIEHLELISWPALPFGGFDELENP